MRASTPMIFPASLCRRWPRRRPTRRVDRNRQTRRQRPEVGAGSSYFHPRQSSWCERQRPGMLLLRLGRVPGRKSWRGRREPAPPRGLEHSPGSIWIWTSVTWLTIGHAAQRRTILFVTILLLRPLRAPPSPSDARSRRASSGGKRVGSARGCRKTARWYKLVADPCGSRLSRRRRALRRRLLLGLRWRPRARRLARVQVRHGRLSADRTTHPI